MKRKLYVFITCIALSLLCFLCFSCGDNESSRTDSESGALPNIDLTDSVNTDDQILELDQTGLFYKTAGVLGVEYNVPVQTLYSSLPNYSYPKSGVKITADAATEGVYYSKVIDLNNFNGDLITFEVLGSATPQVKGIDVELVDIYDADNTVKLSWFVLSADTVSNLLVTCNGISTGCTNENTVTNGLPRIQYGSIDYLSNFIGSLSLVKNHTPFHFRFDNETKEVRADLMSPGDNFCVLDLDNPIHMGEMAWKGFTTGEVYLKISFSKVSGEGSFIITSVAGKNLDSETLTSEPSNTIKIGLEDRNYAYKMPTGAKGTAYPVPSVDNYDILRGEYDVYTMVKDSDGNITDITDNKFIPSVIGEYEIIYSAKDINGYRITRTLTVEIKDALGEMGFVCDLSDDSVLYTNTIEKLPTYRVENYNGTVKINCSYIFNGKTIYPDELGDYVFKASGNLTVNVNAREYSGNAINKTYSYQVVEKPYINLLSPMPKGVVKGSVFTLPEFEICSENKNLYQNKSVYVDGEPLEGNSFNVPTVSDKNGVEIAFYFEKDTDDEVVDKFFVEFTDGVSDLDFSNLFITENVDVVNTEAGLVLETDKNDNNAVFVNPVSATLTEMNFRVTDYKNFEFIEITLTDAVFTDNSISFRLYNSVNLTENFRVQDSYGSFNYYKYPINSKIAITERWHLFYDNTTKSVYNVNLGLMGKILYRTDGKSFGGFESGCLNFSISFGGVSGRSSVAIELLGNQSFKLSNIESGDLRAPELALRGVLDTSQHVLGTELFIPKAVAVDVLTLNSTVSVSLKTPTGKYLLNKEDCNTERVFVLDEVGVYALSFILEDAVHNVNPNKVFYIYVIDKEAPIISGEIEFKENYQVGDKITFTDFNVTDNISKPQDIEKNILIISPNYKYFYIVGESEFTFTEKGYYRIQYCAKDGSDNYTINEHIVKVS